MQVFKKDIVSACKRLLLTSSIGISSVLGYENLNIFRGKAYNIKTAIDTFIPFNRIFVIPYIIWYIYIGIFLFYFSLTNSRNFYKVLLGINFGMLICYIIYYFYPTRVVRPNIQGTDIFSMIVKAIYTKDQPYNCFPSIHAFDAVLMSIYINRDKKIKKVIKYISTFTAISIIAATLFIKQHYIYDAVAGVVLAYGIYFVYNFRHMKENNKSKILRIFCVRRRNRTSS